MEVFVIPKQLYITKSNRGTKNLKPRRDWTLRAVITGVILSLLGIWWIGDQLFH